MEIALNTHSGFIVWVLFLCQNHGIEEYIYRLIRCGYSPSSAHFTCYEVKEKYGLECLEEYVARIERKIYVD